MGHKGTGWERASQALRDLANPAKDSTLRGSRGAIQGGEVSPASEEPLTPCHHPHHELGQSRSCHRLGAAVCALAVGQSLRSHRGQWLR